MDTTGCASKAGYSYVEGRALFEPMYARIYHGSPPRGLFLDYASAKAWSLELLAAKGWPG